MTWTDEADTLDLAAEPPVLVLDAGSSVEEISSLAPMAMGIVAEDALDPERSSYWIEQLENAHVVLGYNRQSRELVPLKNPVAWSRIQAGSGEQYIGHEVLIVSFGSGDADCSLEALTILAVTAGLKRPT